MSVRNTTRKRGRDLQPGDAVDFLNKWYTISLFESHPGLTDHNGVHHTARVACSGDRWGITVFDDDDYECIAKS